MRLPRGRGIAGRRGALSSVSAVPRQLMRKPPGPLISGEHNLKIAALDPEDMYFKYCKLQRAGVASCVTA